MERKTRLKLLLDALMTALMILLMSVSATGMLMHEILGVFVLFLFALHNLLNRDWIVGVTRALFSGRLKAGTVVQYVLDALLYIALGMTGLSGVLISRELFPGSAGGGIWEALHSSFACLSLILVSIHIGFHWRQILGAFRRMAGIRGENAARTWLLRAAALVFAILGIRSSFANDIGRKILQPLDYTAGSGSGNAPELTGEESREDGQVRASAVEAGTDGAAGQETLEGYLSSLYCTGCPRHCPLISPQCSRGVLQAAQAQEEYYASAEDVSGASGGSVQTESGSAAGGETPFVGAPAGESPLQPFADYLPVMGLYIGGTYYLLKHKAGKSW